MEKLMEIDLNPKHWRLLIPKQRHRYQERQRPQTSETKLIWAIACAYACEGAANLHAALIMPWCLQRQDEDHQLRQKTLANPDKNHFLAKARRNSFLTTMPISSTFWCHKRNEINIRQTLGIDIRKEPSRNETTGLDEIREGHRKEIRTIQPTLDT
ncbi:hypothetical protein HGM15179_015767 [Zosterops borbonicus]|uniref:Uncharacterized protein n=1 Tax=Zosterops borbonicus TaxID=364589 RepID=A0A8K1G3V1_9PASS|nr:hypothetical protein HGM15179_015767 [Zosterops borbonicus]